MASLGCSFIHSRDVGSPADIPCTGLLGYPFENFMVLMEVFVLDTSLVPLQNCGKDELQL